jgi:hypothetical protein
MSVSRFVRWLKLWRCSGSTGPLPCGHLNYGWEQVCWMCGRLRDGKGERRV